MEPISADWEFFEDSDGYFEYDYMDNDSSPDSDDEAEEANRNDDIINMIEGDW